MPHAHEAEPAQATRSGDVTPRMQRDLVDCWITVTNAGGAAGFPFPPVTEEDVRPAVERIVDGLDPERARIVAVHSGGVLAGWVLMRHEVNPLVAHWGTIHHLQTHPRFRGRGIGSALVCETQRIARDELGLEQLRLAARSGEGLEGFYQGLGWREVGRWPGALRLAADDTRDEVLMIREPL